MSARLQAAPLVGHLVTDEAYDQTYASDGFSRYGAYLAKRLPPVVDDDPDVLTDPVRWAAFAWASATTPVMSPAYLDWNGPIEDIQVDWDDGDLAVEAVLRTDPPVNLPGWRGWDRDRHGNYLEPWHGDRIVLARIALGATLVGLQLPCPPGDVHSRADVVLTAKAAVSAVAVAVEDVLAPVVVALAHRNPLIRLDGVDERSRASAEGGSTSFRTERPDQKDGEGCVVRAPGRRGTQYRGKPGMETRQYWGPPEFPSWPEGARLEGFAGGVGRPSRARGGVNVRHQNPDDRHEEG